jgi:hypothetical protein
MRKNFFGFEFLAVALVLPGIYFLSLVPTAAEANYLEECLIEGCSFEEIRELHRSYFEECCGEGCNNEEVRELAGGQAYIPQLIQAFRSRGLPICRIGFAAAEAGAAGGAAHGAAEGGHQQVPKSSVWLFSEPDFKGETLEIGPTNDDPSLTAGRAAKLDFKVRSIRLGRLVKKVTCFGGANYGGGGQDITRTTSNYTGQAASVRVEAADEPDARDAKDAGDDEGHKKGGREGGGAQEGGKAQSKEGHR